MSRPTAAAPIWPYANHRTMEHVMADELRERLANELSERIASSHRDMQRRRA